MFNWFYWAINIGALSSIVTTNTEKYHSFWLAYLLPLIVFIGAIVVLIVGRNRYVQKPPSGSLLIRAGRVIGTAIQKRWRFGKQPNHRNLLDYAKETSPQVDENGRGIVAVVNNNAFVDDLKKAVRSCRVFLFYPFYWICYNQMSTNLISQAAQMNVGPLPNDVLQNIDPIVLIVFIPVFDKLIYPCMRRFQINFAPIARITLGFFCISIAMAWAPVVQNQIYATGPNYSFLNELEEGQQKYNDITVVWQTPTYFFIAVSEIFASITGLEYASTQAPASMKGVGMVLWC
ncbi:unnamed protein product [Rotaria sp. Silwood2]|nr:unnamed protein product [Rotaria sp. Silwood2]